MDFIAAMLFTQQVFHLECLLLFQIKSQPCVTYKSVDFKNKEITFPHEFIFIFILYFIETILLEKSCKKPGVGKKYKMGGLPYNEGYL